MVLRINFNLISTNHKKIFLRQKATIQYRFRITLKMVYFFSKFNIYEILTLMLEVKRSFEFSVEKTSTSEPTAIKNKFYGVTGDSIFDEFRLGVFREDHFLELIKSPELIDSRGTFLDIGANYGGHSLHLAKLFPLAKILSFEASSKIFQLLQLNTFKINNIKCFHHAISNTTADILTLDSVDYGQLHNSGAPSATVRKGINTCVSLRIDDLEITDLAFIKIDIQGGELRALEGLVESINRSKPLIFIEIEEISLRKNQTSSEDVLKFLLNLNYNVYRINTEHPIDHIAIYDDSKVNLIKMKYGLTKVPRNFKSLSFKHSIYYDNFT